MKEEEPRNCGDCGAKPGEFHKYGCDVEHCAMCGYQAIGCNCIYLVNGMDMDTLEEKHHDIYMNGPTREMEKKFDEVIEKLGGRLPWTGFWPCSKEAAEFGWWSKFDSVKGRWVTCSKDDPEASPDLNKFATCAKWNKEKRIYERLV